jgi:cysteine desulfurase/selenocysteine lyase
MQPDFSNIRQYFPILSQRIHGHKPLVYFDNAATTQKPQVVLDALQEYYQTSNANVYRGVHTLAERATAALEETRQTVKNFINAQEAAEIIFTAGTTASLNLVASSYGRHALRTNDTVLITAMEHHANIVPWQLICQTQGAKLAVAPINDQGELVVEAFEQLLLERKPKIVSLAYVSNNLGTINPLQELIEKAHAVGAVVVVDAAQAIPHMSVDVQQLNCDFLAFSAHKAYGPTGVGVLYGKRALLDTMPPYQGGGDMIRDVTFESSTYNEIPHKFEAGTPNIAGIVAFQTALAWLTSIGWERLQAHEMVLRQRLEAALIQLSGLRIIGTAPHKVGIVSFTMEPHHPFDIGLLLDAQGIAVRVGYGCAQPLMKRLGLEEGVVRVSFAAYNTLEEVDYLVEKLAAIGRQ